MHSINRTPNPDLEGWKKFSGEKASKLNLKGRVGISQMDKVGTTLPKIAHS